MLRAEYKRSGLTIAEVAKVSGVSTPSVHVAVNGFRYYDRQKVVTVPPSKTLVKLAAALSIDAAKLRAVGREDAAQLLEETPAYQLPTPATALADVEAATSARQTVIRQVLGVFSTNELLAEIERRESALADDEPYVEDVDSAFHAELTDDLRTEQWPQ